MYSACRIGIREGMSLFMAMSFIVAQYKFLMMFHTYDLGPPQNVTQLIEPMSTSLERPIEYFDSKNFVAISDAYAASWWQSVDRFERMDVTNGSLSNLESAVFSAVRINHRRDVRMTKDFLDFSAEHLSKWYKGLNAHSPDYPKSFGRIMSILLNFLWSVETVGIDNVMDKDEVARRGRTTSHEATMTRPKTQTKKVSWADIVRGSHRQ